MRARIAYGLALVLVAAAGAIGADVAHFFAAPLANSQPRLIEVSPGTTFRALMHQLHREHIIPAARDERYLSIYARLHGQARRVKSGQYLIPPNQKPAQLVALLVSGKIREHRLTLVEGWRFRQIMQAVESDPNLKHTLEGKTNAQIMAAIGHPNQKAEGRFMPDTYFFPRGETDVTLLKRAYQAMQTFLKKAWAHRATDVAVKTPYQALIMASMIEKETAAPAERGRIAGVFSRRLRQGMRLQSDPTVIYGIHDFNGNLTRADLQHDTPYNTYTRGGLPPTPICSPSRASIRAALHPVPGKAMYFVSRGNGTQAFAATLAQQNRNVRKYQKGGS